MHWTDQKWQYVTKDFYKNLSKNPEKKYKFFFSWFLKDHVTMKTGVMAAENSALPSQ